MRFFNYSLIVAGALALTASSASAQTAFEVEGKIVSIIPEGEGARMRVMGVEVVIPPGTPISTPTASLTVAQLLDAEPMPGRTEGGFLGGTAIITGTTGSFGPVAGNVFVEPSENVVLGQFTGAMQFEGMPVELLTDARMPALPLINVFGFEVIASSITAGTPAAMEGYYGDDGVFRAFLIESEGGTLTKAGIQDVSVLRAQCRQRRNGTIEFSVSGATHDPATGAVTLKNVAGTRTYGTVLVTPDEVDPQFGSFSFSVQSNGLGPCPSQVVATFGTASATGTVAVRID